MHVNRDINFLKAHLNVSWLRPENTLWDAAASEIIAGYKIGSPSLDLGCGNGMFSFITAGGSFTLDYDWFLNTNIEGFYENRDIYDADNKINISDCILNKPKYKFSFGLDNKPNLLAQAKGLKFYSELKKHDANLELPFEENYFSTIFSNIIYWLSSPQKTLLNIYKILKKKGKAILCLPSPEFFEYCESYKWKEKQSVLLNRLNRGRSETMQWVAGYDEIEKTAKNIGFNVVDHCYYISKLTAKIWDIGLRPLSPLLIRMANSLSPDERRSIKKEWIDNLMEFLLPLYDIEVNNGDKGAFQVIVLEK